MSQWEDIHEDDFLCDLKNENYIYMQFTWLTDKNWKDIYEGDIVIEGKWTMNEHMLLVEFNNDNSWYYPFSKPAYGGYEWDSLEPSETEVIGNIYENKDLLNN